MPKTRSRKIADLLSPASVAGTLSVDGGGGVATYTAIGDLPSSGLTAGDMAFVDSSDRLYIWAGAGSPYYLDGYMQDLRVTKGLARYTTTFTPPAALLEG